ncbi:uncharacterized protein LOC125187245 [Salvia hispanica]|uniref:uncharacterized protein LOC125187245 n=1 Tax=Salvia hispanica TaxID=49212 RepID=UPI0020099DAC|nr:uncharacterized protein LOC125187245 [Salvia hispanica]
MEELVEEDRVGRRKPRASSKATRTYIHRNREEVAVRLERDYFDRNRYGEISLTSLFPYVTRLFLHIANTLAAGKSTSEKGFNVVGRPSHTTLKKCIAAIRRLATTTGFVRRIHARRRIQWETLFDELLQRRPAAFTDEFPRSQPPQIVVRSNFTNKCTDSRMLGSVDCLHWQWKNCPVAWGGHTRSASKAPTPLLYSRSSPTTAMDLACIFGAPGSNNDVNVLNNSDLFDEVRMWTTFVKTFTAPAKKTDSFA